MKNKSLQEVKLMNDVEYIKLLIVKCFKNNPVACDGRLSVAADDYNELVEFINKV